jgi:hypothetical protein
VSITRRLPEAFLRIPKGVNHVEGLCPGYVETAADSGASGACPFPAQTRQKRRMVNVDAHGFPVGRAKWSSRLQGFSRGLVRVAVTKGKKVGTYVGRVRIKTDRYFKITGKKQWPRGEVTNIWHSAIP